MIQEEKLVQKRNRRDFLKQGGLAVGAMAAGSALVQTVEAKDLAGAPAEPLPAVPESMQYPGADTGTHPYGVPSSFEQDVVRKLAPNGKQYSSSLSRTPLEELDGIITPNGLFYERHHGGIPEIDPQQHRLMIHGLVERSLVLTMEEIRRYPSVSRIHFLECSGNPTFLNVKAPTAGELFGLTSCAEWTGVPLKTVLEEAGLKPEAKWLIAEGADAAAMNRSIPIEKCLDDALLVYSQNGERLRPEQGYPLRVFLPGYEGNMSIKWVRRLHLTEEPIYAKEETSKYTDLMPDGTARQFTYVMEAKSIITRPSGTQKIAPGFNEISGIAWTGYGKIAKVEVSVDDGKTWQEAELQEPVLTRALTRFRLPWVWEGKPATIVSRAIDETGYVQPTLEELIAIRGVNSHYHNNMTQPWKIAENGEVTNARL